jgi:hypothetical protein
MRRSKQMHEPFDGVYVKRKGVSKREKKKKKKKKKIFFVGLV